MILRYSAALGKKIHYMPEQTLPLDPNPYADWSAHLFRADRLQYILITNTVSLYSMILYGRGNADDSDFLRTLRSEMREFITDDGFGAIYEERIAPAWGEIYEARALNKSVTGSMTELVRIAEHNLHERQLSPLDASLVLNGIPMGALKYKTPRQAFAAM